MSPLLTNDRSPLCGPLHAHINAYLKLLEERGYKQSTIRPDSLLLADLDDWLARKSHRLIDLNETILERFLHYHMRRRHSRRQAKRATLDRLLVMLRKDGCIAAAKVSPPSPAQQLLDVFEYYLSDELGFVKTTVAGYITTAGQFLRTTFGEELANVAKLDARAVVTFVQIYAHDHGRVSAHYVTRALRSFFRFLRHRGYVTTDLASAVPRVAFWSLAGLPKHLPADGVDRVLARCNDTTAIGRRNHAIVLILARLGLRSCEVADLRLDDLDWQHGLVRVRSSKGGRWTSMPLPKEVGQALASYLEKARPRCACREVFLRHQAPVGGLTPMAIRHVASAAICRAGITGVCLGSHTFRHTLATDLLRRGASLDEIGEVLRHKDASTTAIYAKVDLTTLRSLAMCWPGGMP
jgi:site-specific recombinase XerD